VEEGLFPHPRSLDSEEELEEERRLCYVGMTRARKKLFMYSARTRTLFGEMRYRSVSRFVEEIEPGLIDAVSIRDEYVAKEVEPGAAGVYVDDEPYYTSEDSQLDPTDDPFRVGMKVRHPSFGTGIIRMREGNGEATKLTVDFRSTGPKKLMIKYASLVPV
ncbi:MAG: 3'-5' exonuclease, partial [Thermodesulfobacteriota bacterium]